VSLRRYTRGPVEVVAKQVAKGRIKGSRISTPSVPAGRRVRKARNNAVFALFPCMGLLIAALPDNPGFTYGIHNFRIRGVPPHA
jgi:hypothetical protein